MRWSAAAWFSLSVGLVVGALPWEFANATRPLFGDGSILVVPRVSQYFVGGPERESPYIQAATAVRAAGCERIGLDIGPDGWDYPLWVLLRDATHTAVAIEYVNVSNLSSVLDAYPFTPCAVIATVGDAANGLTLHGQGFHPELHLSAGVTLLVPGPT
jgi:hypothetical protein